MDQENQGVIYIENWNDLCRLCLRNEQSLQNLFFEETLLENIQEVTNLHFNVEDSLPNSICKICIEQVNSFVEFRVRCKATDEWLRNEAVILDNDNKDNIEIVEVVDIWNDGTSLEKKESIISQLCIENTDDKFCLCEDCGECFETTKQLTLHTKTHSSDHVKCNLCNEVIDNYSKFDSSLVKDEIILCKKCKNLNNIDNLEVKNSYTEIEGGFLCEKCQKVFKTLAGMLSHLRNYEKKLEIGSLSYQCHFCEEVFATIQQVWIHMKTHAPGEKIKCRHCEKCFKSYLTLVRHENKHEGTFNYVCSYCGRAFVTPYGRDRHEMTHNAAKDVQCEKCTMTFYTRAEYNRHMRYHDNVRNFLCSFCGKRFFESAHKTIHERAHTGERPFACNFCGKKFMSKQKARRHQAIHSRHKNKK
ncbi:zinc finger protein 25-like isoform X2 [Rhopalosiphum maidis]|uniref:zinc finger protein 25-like isoform X2 n=1 Tax=Rhopalosiphum maidis TaxID=43146 RepID=UPI000EFDD0EA|nr:zinc finger protein 25-like isoform X2 [Rhopalosiphum maidis]